MNKKRVHKIEKGLQDKLSYYCIVALLYILPMNINEYVPFLINTLDTIEKG